VTYPKKETGRERATNMRITITMREQVTTALETAAGSDEALNG